MRLDVSLTPSSVSMSHMMSAAAAGGGGGGSGSDNLEMTLVIPTDNYQTNWAGGGSGLDGSVDWGDGTTDDFTGSSLTTFSHTFTTAGTYNVVVSGTWRRFYYNNTNARDAITTVSNLGLCGWTSLNSMFRNCKNLTSFTAGNCDTSAVTDMKLFLSMTFVTAQLTSVDLTGMDTSSVTNMQEAFNGQNVLTEFTGIGDLNVSNVTTFKYCFQSCSRLTTLDLSSWDTSSATNMSYMFQYSFNNSLDQGNYNVNLAGWNLTSVTRCENMFNTCGRIDTYGDLSGWVLSSATRADYMFYNNSNLTTLDASGFDFSSVTNITYMFGSCGLMTDFSFLNSWNISSSLTTMFSFLYFCRDANVSIDLTGWDVSNCTNFRSAFRSYGSDDLNTDRTINIANWDVTSCTDFQYMFNSTGSKISGLGTWSMSHATTLQFMFTGIDNTNSWSLDAFNWTLTNCTNMQQTFAFIPSSAGVDISSISTWTTPALTNLYQTFYNCDSDIPDLSAWDTSNVTNMSQTFIFSTLATGAGNGFASWDVTSVTNGSSFLSSASGFDTTAYDLLLVAWEADVAAASGYSLTPSFSFGTTKYSLGSAAETARTALINTHGWSITDGGGI